MPDTCGSLVHMRNFRPAVDERSVRKPAPATDTSVYSSAWDSRACGDEADGGSFLMHNAKLATLKLKQVIMHNYRDSGPSGLRPILWINA